MPHRITQLGKRLHTSPERERERERNVKNKLAAAGTIRQVWLSDGTLQTGVFRVDSEETFTRAVLAEC